ncbi:MAG: hypothetical protein ACYTFI_01370 [Planctomycetota bacterium]|jgi:hypothetical protein
MGEQARGSAASQELSERQVRTSRFALAVLVLGILMGVLASFSGGVSSPGGAAALFGAGMLPFVISLILGMRSRRTVLGRLVFYVSIIMACVATFGLVSFIFLCGIKPDMSIVH